MHLPELFCEITFLNKLGNWFLYELYPKNPASQTLLKVTRLVVLWLKEMVMMVSRRGSESNIKSDLGIWAKYRFLKLIIHFYSMNTLKRISPS